MDVDFEIRHLDHVAIRARDLEISASWYSHVLGLKRYDVEKWGPFPIFMLAGKTGVAIFPANISDPDCDIDSKNIRIDHFAFNVSMEDLQKARKKYLQLGIEFTEEDHFYFDSIYTKDPDGHTVELTAIKTKEEDFYGDTQG